MAYSSAALGVGNIFDGIGSVDYNMLGYPTDPQSLAGYDALANMFTAKVNRAESPLSWSPLSRIKRLMGTSWVFHPDYKPLPRHNVRHAVGITSDSVLYNVRKTAIAAGRLPE